MYRSVGMGCSCWRPCLPVVPLSCHCRPPSAVLTVCSTYPTPWCVINVVTAPRKTTRASAYDHHAIFSFCAINCRWIAGLRFVIYAKASFLNCMSDKNTHSRISYNYLAPFWKLSVNSSLPFRSVLRTWYFSFASLPPVQVRESVEPTVHPPPPLPFPFRNLLLWSLNVP